MLKTNDDQQQQNKFSNAVKFSYLHKKNLIIFVLIAFISLMLFILIKRKKLAEHLVPNGLWSDQFDYYRAPKSSMWHIVNEGGGFGNNEAQFYTPQNVNVNGGYLTITARKQNSGSYKYTSGKLERKYDFTYGIFEMRAKIPQGRGTWPAFWLVNGDNWPLNGEIEPYISTIYVLYNKIAS